jgi:hypothetical protein
VKTHETAKYFLLIENEPAGPLTLSDIAAMLRDGVVTVENYVATDGAQEWKKLSDVPEFAKLHHARQS